MSLEVLDPPVPKKLSAENQPEGAFCIPLRVEIRNDNGRGGFWVVHAETGQRIVFGGMESATWALGIHDGKHKLVLSLGGVEVVGPPEPQQVPEN